YQGTYGSLGGVIILMTWLYITAFVLVFGAEVNVTLEQQRRTADASQPARPNDDARPQRSARPRPEEVAVERRQPRSGRGALGESGPAGALSATLGALVAGVVFMRLLRWRRPRARGEVGL